MKALKIIGIIIAVLAVVVFVTIQLLPDEAHISRSITIDASPGEVYREVVSFKNFTAWSPWSAKDTATVYTAEGPAQGVGTKLSWKSESDQVGSGSMKIIEVEPGALVKTEMKFEGFDSTPNASYIIEEVDGGTKVTWTYDEMGISGIGRVFGLMMDMFLGPDYEQGLKNLKARIESAPEASTDISVVFVEPYDYLGVSFTTDMSMIATKMAQSYGTLMSYMGKEGIEMSGKPIAVCTLWSEEQVAFTCGIPVSVPTSDLAEGVVRESIPAGLAVKSVYMGDYNDSGVAHEEIEAYVNYAGYEFAGPPWEEYVTDPMEEKDTAKWVTNVYYPVQ